MGATWTGRFAATFGVLGLALAVRGDEPANLAGGVSIVEAVPSKRPVPPSTGALTTASPAGLLAWAADPQQARTDAIARLKSLVGREGPGVGGGVKDLRELLNERIRWLDAWDEAVRNRRLAEHPEPSPEVQAAEAKADLERTRALVAQAVKAPSEVLPPVFRRPNGEVTDALGAEMKDAIDAAKTELKTWKDKAEKLRAEDAGKASNPVAALRAERDKIHQRVAALPPRRAQREAAVASAKSADAQTLAAERLVNLEWETRVETERLLGQEARIALEARLADLASLYRQVADTHVVLASRALGQMQERFRTLTDRQERVLEKAAAREQKKAARADDPIERYRARSLATLLELEAQVLKLDKALNSSGSSSFEEQKALADRADSDFAGIKHLLDDGKVSQLDALRFNNDFRRIGPERARVVSHELATADRNLTFYENALSSVELELINDRRADQYEHETLLEQLPKARHPEARALFDEIDHRHETLLNKNREKLEKLARRAEETHNQILRRLRTLDDQYGFIRTHIFWVRDQEPIGATTLALAEREALLLAKSLGRLALEGADRTLWGRLSVEFLVAIGLLGVLPWPLGRLRKTLRSRARDRTRPAPGLSTLRGLVQGALGSGCWPAYIILVAYAARQAPWPRSLALPISWSLAILAPALFASGLCRWMLRPGGWAEQEFRVPEDVSRQLRRAVLVMAVIGLPLLLTQWVLGLGLIAPAGRPIAASAFCRFLEIGVDLVGWGIVFRLARGRSPLVQWLLQFPERLGWLNRRRRVVCWSVLAALGGGILLDVLGFRFTAGRLAIDAVQGILLAGFCWFVYRMLLRAIDQHAWRWVRPRVGAAGTEAHDESTTPPDLANRLRRLAAYLAPAVGLLLAAWIWDVDWALFRFLGEQVLWHTDKETPVTVGDVAKFAVILGITAAVWRHLSTFFAVAVFPRMRDDPGVRFAVVTLCRYAVLGVGLLASLSAIHLGLEKIGMVLAALGVGLGFGLQEIVSNFVCGIILLLERPIRVGDVVTVSGMSGKVERINIRATTITNGDNQSIIVPNRAFITSDLINWTLKDKVIRVSIRLKVAQRTDPDRVSDLLLAIAREDPDVLRNPLPASFMEDFSESALNFVLHVHVPEPGLGARVRHRLFAQIQRRFAEVGIEIPFPTQELRVQPFTDATGRTSVVSTDMARVDPPSSTPPAPRYSTPAPVPAPVEDCHRGVDE